MTILPGNRQRGFTLVELLVVLMILAILASLLVVVSGQSLKNAQYANAQTQIQKITSSIKGYYTDTGRFPLPQGFKYTEDDLGNPIADMHDRLTREVDKIIDELATWKGSKYAVQAEAVDDSGPAGVPDGKVNEYDRQYITDPWGNEIVIVLSPFYADAGVYAIQDSNGNYMNNIKEGFQVYSIGPDGVAAQNWNNKANDDNKQLCNW